MDEPERARQVQLAAAGDLDALQRLVVHYHAPLCGVVERAIEPTLRPYLDPEDVLQEAYVTAFKTVADCTFDGPGGFYKWLEKLAHNQLKPQQRALRRQKRDVARNVAHQRPAGASYPDLLHRLASTESSPSRRVAKHEASAAVMASLARLTDDQRAVIRMRILEDRPAAEVATALGKSEPAVHMLCHRGLKELRRLLVSITRYLTRL
jgi:RNA polymerase sigma-70 factor (subfamily 1)